MDKPRDIGSRIDTDSLARRILDSNPVLFGKVTAALDCDRSEVPTALREVIRFLVLVAGRKSGMLTPSHRVDLAWHEFILCTRVYSDFCNREFGQFVHHTPGGEDDQNQRQYETTLTLYRSAFGLPDTRYWPEPHSRADCGACEALV